MVDLGWRSMIFPFLETNNLTDIYQFGVYSGKSMLEIAYLYRMKNIDFRMFYGLDSFEGMPQDNKEEVWQDCWNAGEFDSRQLFNTDSIEECINKIKNLLKPCVTPKESCFIPGFFNQTLTIDAKEKYGFKPAHYIDIDVDIYGSTIFVLEYVIQNKLIKNGTLIGYDDWGGSPGWQYYQNGESRAHKEIEEKYNIEFELLAQNGNNYPHVQRLYKVISI